MVDALDLGSPVVISPSLSGMYSLPFLTAPGSQLRGYVPVAPICTEKISTADYAGVKVPVWEAETPLPRARKSPSWGLSLSGGWGRHGWLLGGVRSPPSALLINWAHSRA